MNYKKYIILEIEEVKKINFSDIKETSYETLRKSINGKLTFVEVEVRDINKILKNLKIIKLVDYSELLNILSSTEWTKEDDKI